MSNHNPAQASKKRDLVITRVFDAPVGLVWNAWTDPERVMHWWGPNGFTSLVVLGSGKPLVKDINNRLSLVMPQLWDALSANVECKSDAFALHIHTPCQQLIAARN